MKRLILAATVISASLLPFTCSANADSLGINKDCDNHPVSQYGMNSITASGQYKAEPQKFMKVMTEFCNRGKTMGDMGFKAASSLSLTESKKWTDANLPDQNEEQKKFASNIANLLSFAMLNGFSGFDYPEPPKQKNALPTDSFKPFEICDVISSNAAEQSTSQLHPQVQISLTEWNQIKKEFASVCFAGIMNGNSQKPADGKLIAGLNDIARSVFYQAYEIGLKYPPPESAKKENADAEKESARANEAARKKVAEMKNGLNPGAGGAKNADEKKQQNINNEIQGIQSSIQSSLSRVLGDKSRFITKQCQLRLWFSQKGDVLSVKTESGDTELCSVVSNAAKKIKLTPMSDQAYRMYRNTLLEIKP